MPCVGVVAEGLLEQHHVERRARAPPRRSPRAAARCRWRRAAARRVRSRRRARRRRRSPCRAASTRTSYAAEAVPVDPAATATEAHRRVGRDPHPGLLDDVGRAEHVERLASATQRPEQQERRRAVVGVRVGEQHVPQPGQVEPGALGGVRRLRAAVQQQRRRRAAPTSARAAGRRAARRCTRRSAQSGFGQPSADAGAEQR